MAQASFDDITRVLVMPGRVVKAPTDISIGQTFPFGGTSYGLTETGVILERIQNFQPITVEEYGNEPVRVIYTGDEVKLTVQLVQDGDETKDVFWQGLTVTGATSGNKNIEWPGDGSSMYAGKDLADNAIALAFLPEDITNQIVFYARKATPVGAPVQLGFNAENKVIWECQFLCLRDDSIASGNARYESRGFFLGDRRDLVI